MIVSPRMNFRAPFLALGLALLAGCATVYELPADKPAADFQLSVLTDSTAGGSRAINTFMFKNEHCEASEYGARGTPKPVFGDADIAADPVRILAGEKFVFTTFYADGRFAQVRQCGVTGAFVPQPGHRYKALLLVSGDVSACRLGIYDVTSGSDAQIPFSMPPQICELGGKIGRRNGRPLWTDYDIRFEASPTPGRRR